MKNTYKYNRYHKMHKNTQNTDNMHFRLGECKIYTGKFLWFLRKTEVQPKITLYNSYIKM